MNSRFYVDGELAVGIDLALPRDLAHHALRVLRLAEGDMVTLFNGRGGEYGGSLHIEGKHDASVRLDLHDTREAELGFEVRIGQGLCAAEKMDWLIEKSVELGAAAIAPLALQKSVVRLSEERAQKRAMHWQQLVIASSQQCGRNRLMQVAPSTDLRSWLASQQAIQHRLVLAPGTSETLSGFARRVEPAATCLLVGPEGGLSASELEAARKAGFTPLGLGPRILRTETAAMAALAMLSALWQR